MLDSGLHMAKNTSTVPYSLELSLVVQAYEIPFAHKPSYMHSSLTSPERI